MRIYIAGQVSGLAREKVKKNFLRGHVLLSYNGYEPVNPLDAVSPSDGCNKKAMEKLLPILLRCDGILMLNGWEFSHGAKIEYELAKYAKLKVIMEDDLLDPDTI